MPKIRRIRRAHVERVAAMLTTCAKDSPFCHYLFPDEALRPVDVLTYHRWLVAAHVAPRSRASALMTGDGDEVILWSRGPLAVPPPPAFRQDGVMERWIRLSAYPGAYAWPSPFLMLAVLGVDTDRERGGSGSALLDHLVGEADALGVPITTETVDEKPLPLLAQFGFEVVRIIEPEQGGLRRWLVVREPG